MRLTVEPEEVEAAVIDFVQKRVGANAEVSVIHFTRIKGTSSVKAEVHVEAGTWKPEEDV